MMNVLMLAATLQTPDFSALERDWRNGPIVYQVFVDRFAPSGNLEGKRALYAPPRTLHPWSEIPKVGDFVQNPGVWSQELAFWGGDLKSLDAKLGYIRELGVDVLYLNPIAKSITNHKYDTEDYEQISPEYGTRKDLTKIARDLHGAGMKLMLDGVFNHMGNAAPIFQKALKDPRSRYRSWFLFSGTGNDYSGWGGSPHLPELRLENPEVRNYLWEGSSSVVQKFMREGVDGWRLDSANNIGPKILSGLTASAHEAKPGSAIVGELWNYPAPWFPSVDGAVNMYLGTLILSTAKGETSGVKASHMIDQMIADAGLPHILKSWIVLDNHDTSRLATTLPDPKQRHLAQLLQFTLPGAPLLFYGTELGMKGAGDPETRSPMRWDLDNAENLELAWVRRLIQIRKSYPALRYGEFKRIESDKLLAFVRDAGKALGTVIVVANPSNETVTERLGTRSGFLMDGSPLQDVLSGAKIFLEKGTIVVEVPPHEARILVPLSPSRGGFTPYKRVP